ncbi:hypothetical protein [Spirilliplanes yamanashiensis]|uniref:Excreted virulence factor EspC (Type VII ESX diderm) n=1 Tax=Spirilliplanes yamanashiensis TaxID=42233 RepID=A0A8J3Y8X7_9ACTN|nr:hypothetical protein [Spirilliplanes yamanashiensis]MDP9815920.1 hypothetical protein [Spirilliplanes yamanashiensis]GIJ04176.1 hypothetical protein Sya03_35280 [Spirilliplanes yamanashiensis]
MNGDLAVDLDALGRTSPRLTTIAAHLADDPPAGPPLAGTAPGWSTTAALDRLRLAAEAHARDLATTVESLASALATTAERYADADDRAAHRLRTGR